MNINKNRFIDTTDRNILRVLYITNPLSGNEIANHLELSLPCILSRLKKLEQKGILKKERSLKKRVFKRKIKGVIRNIESCRGIYWNIDLKKRGDHEIN